MMAAANVESSRVVVGSTVPAVAGQRPGLPFMHQRVLCPLCRAEMRRDALVSHVPGQHIGYTYLKEPPPPSDEEKKVRADPGPQPQRPVGAQKLGPPGPARRVPAGEGPKPPLSP